MKVNSYESSSIRMRRNTLNLQNADDGLMSNSILYCKADINQFSSKFATDSACYIVGVARFIFRVFLTGNLAKEYSLKVLRIATLQFYGNVVAEIFYLVLRGFG